MSRERLQTIRDLVAHPPRFDTDSNGAQTNSDLLLGDIIDQITQILHRYIKFEENGLATVIACWIIQTFCFEIFEYCGYVALRSPTPRCGKSRLLKLIALFVDSLVIIIPTAATIFRSTRRVLLLDEVDQLRNKDKETFGVVLSVLNSGFEKGGVIERVEKEKGSFVVKSYNVYGPKALAGIEGLADTLADRCFQIPMKRRASRSSRMNLRRMKPSIQGIQQNIRKWLAQRMEQIEELYEGLPDEIHQLNGFDDRFQDISEPLVVLAQLADTERGNDSAICADLLEGLKHCAGKREAAGREQNFLAFLELLELRMGDQDEVFISTADLVELCQDHEELSYLENGRRLAGFLRPFDLSARKNKDRNQRGYVIMKTWVEQWRASYPMSEPGEDQ